jgi:hypothetical protein
MATDRRRRRAEPTYDWGQLELLCGWPEQRDHEHIRPMVLFGSPASERAKETGAASERTLQRRAARFEAEVEAATGRLREVAGRGPSSPRSRARSKGTSPSTTSGRAGGSRR